MARAADVPLSIDDFQEVSDRTPYLADLKCFQFKLYAVLGLRAMLI
jgi:dihydroxyacid dehydratase/phosphogluconate dehydratase